MDVVFSYSDSTRFATVELDNVRYCVIDLEGPTRWAETVREWVKAGNTIAPCPDDHPIPTPNNPMPKARFVPNSGPEVKS